MGDDLASKNTLPDFFISYAHQDWQWAKWINQQLEEAKYSTILPDRDFLPGGHVILKDEMDEETRKLWAERAVRAVSLALPSVEEHIIQAHVHYCIPLIEEWKMSFPEAERVREYAEEIHEHTDR